MDKSEDQANYVRFGSKSVIPGRLVSANPPRAEVPHRLGSPHGDNGTYVPVESRPQHH
jgi:hypothetical protein